MPTIIPFSDQLQSTDMIYGTSKGIDSLYKVYEEKKVHVDRGNKGADFGITEKVVSTNELKIGKTNSGFSKEGVARNREYVNTFSKLPKKYVDSITAKQHDSRQIRRKCKSILYWQLVIKGLRVQFVVSGLDLEAVPKKQTYLPGEKNNEYSEKRLSSRKDNKEYGITDAELRWVFRNRKVDKVQAGVQFWKTSDGERYGRPVPCEAPWDMGDYKAAWKEYELSMEEKKGPKGVNQPMEELFWTDWIMAELGQMG